MTDAHFTINIFEYLFLLQKIKKNIKDPISTIFKALSSDLDIILIFSPPIRMGQDLSQTYCMSTDHINTSIKLLCKFFFSFYKQIMSEYYDESFFQHHLHVAYTLRVKYRCLIWCYLFYKLCSLWICMHVIIKKLHVSMHSYGQALLMQTPLICQHKLHMYKLKQKADQIKEPQLV